MNKHYTTMHKVGSSLALAASLLTLGAEGSAQRRAPDFALEGTSGATRRLSSYAGRVVILVYEDRDSSQQNDALKRELAARAQDATLSREVALLPIANLDGYGWWPARGFARDAVVDIARQQHHEILIDWSSTVARAYRFEPRTSHVLVIDRSGLVRYEAAGGLDAAQRAEFFRVLETVVGSEARPAQRAAQAP